MFENQGGVWQVISNVGGGIAFLALLSLILPFFGMEVRGMDLLDSWGTQTGLFIRVSAIIIGALIWFFAKKKV